MKEQTPRKIAEYLVKLVGPRKALQLLINEIKDQDPTLSSLLININPPEPTTIVLKNEQDQAGQGKEGDEVRVHHCYLHGDLRLSDVILNENGDIICKKCAEEEKERPF
jgi:hypothetical protein